MENKNYKLKIKALDESGTFEGYASVFNNEDLTGDIIEPGAFTKTLKENPKLPILWQHDATQPVGVTLEAFEDDKGLRVKGQLNLDTVKGREAYSLLKQGAIKGLSIGYNVIKDAWDDTVRRIKEVKLWEWSLVTFPANPLAQVEAVKMNGLELVDVEWNREEAMERVKNVKNNDEAFIGPFLIADVIDGKLKAVKGAIYDAGISLIVFDHEKENKQELMKKIEWYYHKMNEVPPWKRSMTEREFKELSKHFALTPSEDTQSLAEIIDELKKLKMEVTK